MRRFEDKGITLENSTKVSNIPASDTFSVEDHWVVAADGPDHVILSVYFAPRFVKRTMFKSLIEKNVRQETSGWFLAYVDKVKTILGNQEGDLMGKGKKLGMDELEQRYLVLTAKLEQILPWLVAIASLLLAILVVLVCQLAVSWNRAFVSQSATACFPDYLS